MGVNGIRLCFQGASHCEAASQAAQAAPKATFTRRLYLRFVSSEILDKLTVAPQGLGSLRRLRRRSGEQSLIADAPYICEVSKRQSLPSQTGHEASFADRIMRLRLFSRGATCLIA